MLPNENYPITGPCVVCKETTTEPAKLDKRLEIMPLTPRGEGKIVIW